MASEPNTKNATRASAILSLFEGDAAPFTANVLLRVHTGLGSAPPLFTRQGPNVPIEVPFHDGVGDTYAVSASSDGYRQGGCFFKADPHVLAQPKILLLPNHPTPKFLRWVDFQTAQPRAATFLATGSDFPTAQAQYEELARSKPKSLACLLNLTQAMAEIKLGGVTPLDYFRAICWDGSMSQDRFFGYVDRKLVEIVRAAAEQGGFSEEKDCATFHPGSTHSWKQIAFPVANVQLTFHENDARFIDGVDCVKIEPDIDLYKELLAHGFGEIFPNLITGNLTDPAAVFVLRWAIAEDAGGPAFVPGYQFA